MLSFLWQIIVMVNSESNQNLFLFLYLRRRNLLTNYIKQKRKKEVSSGY
jgi:hypothetical protein